MDRHTLKERESSTKTEKDRVKHTYIDTCIIHTCIQTEEQTADKLYFNASILCHLCKMHTGKVFVLV